MSDATEFTKMYKDYVWRKMERNEKKYKNVGEYREAMYREELKEVIDPGCCQLCLRVIEGPIDMRDLAKMSIMYVCPQCGNKRCPRVQWHGYKCTNSNEPDQVPERLE